jgi:hypothetical protein
MGEVIPLLGAERVRLAILVNLQSRLAEIELLLPEPVEQRFDRKPVSCWSLRPVLTRTSIRPVNPLFGNYASYASFRSYHVPLKAGDQVDMGMHYRLPGCLPHIHTQIVAIRVQIENQLRLSLPNQSKGGLLLIVGQFKKVGDMAKRDD